MQLSGAGQFQFRLMIQFVPVTINYQLLLAGPVFPLFQVYASDNAMCNPAVSNGTYTCNITQTTTFYGQWFYSTGCPPVNYVPVTVVVDPCAGIDEQEERSVSVFPNPTTGNFRVISGLTGLLTVELYDYTGKLAYSTTAYDGAEIVAPLPVGIYALSITDGCNSVSTKLTITE
jgi:Secretion system C-terminal sorting domain